MTRWGLTLPLPNLPLREHAELGARRRGGRVHGPVERRDEWARRLYAAGAVGGLDRAGAAGHRRGRRLHPRAGPAGPAGGRPGGRQQRQVRAGHRRLLGPNRRGLEPDGVREAADQDVADARVPAGGVLRRAHVDGLQARAATGGAIADRARGPARQDAQARGREGRRRVHQLPPPCRAAQGHRGARRRAPGLRAAVPLLLPARRAGPGRAPGPVHVRLLRHRAGVRGVLSLARLRRSDRRDGRRLEGEGPRGRRGSRPVGADRGHIHLRDARRDARAPGGLRGRRHHAADRDPDHDPRSVRGDDRGAGAG